MTSNEFDLLWQNTPGNILDNPSMRLEIENQAASENSPWVRIVIRLKDKSEVRAIAEVKSGTACLLYFPDGKQMPIGNSKKWNGRMSGAIAFLERKKATIIPPTPTPAPQSSQSPTSTSAPVPSAPTTRKLTVNWPILAAIAMFLLFVIGGGGFWTGWAAHRSISDDKPITKENSEVTRVANERTAAITTATEPPFPLPPSDGETPTPPPGDKALKSPNTDRASHQSSGAATGVKQATELAEKLSRGNPFPDLDPTSDGNPTATGVKQATELAEKLSRENSWPK